jgi:hypothetical protein
MAQRAIRFSVTTDKGIREAVEKRGFSSPTAFIRHAVERELAGRQDELVSAEARLTEPLSEPMAPEDCASEREKGNRVPRARNKAFLRDMVVVLLMG